jgi:hypothetical protein
MFAHLALICDVLSLNDTATQSLNLPHSIPASAKQDGSPFGDDVLVPVATGRWRCWICLDNIRINIYFSNSSCNYNL